MTKKVVAIACSDLHFRHTAPVARSTEPDWYAAMGKWVKELTEISEQYDAPILCAGDIFHRWDSPHELVNWVYKNAPTMYTIPGQHDLPEHSAANVHRSAYETLCHTGRISDLGTEPCEWNGCLVYPFKFGDLLKDATKFRGVSGDCLKIAVVHSYIWEGHNKYEGAPDSGKVSNLERRLHGYDVAIFGDNHKGFLTKVGNCNVINCGCIYPARSDEVDYKPSVGLIYNDGSVEREFLDTVSDSWLTDRTIAPAACIDDTRFAKLLEQLTETTASDSLDFTDAIMRNLEKSGLSEQAKSVVVNVMDSLEVVHGRG